MRAKALAALLLTVILLMAALTSEQRRMESEVSVDGDVTAVTKEEFNATN